jgi:hypothetical protein
MGRSHGFGDRHKTVDPPPAATRGAGGLYDTRVTDAGLAHLADFPNLRSLNIHGAGISEAGLAHLAYLTNLEVLYFNCAEISGAGLAHIQGLPKLATLYLVDADITDVELAHLKEFKKLTQLWFYNQEITEGACLRPEWVETQSSMSVFIHQGVTIMSGKTDAVKGRIKEAAGALTRNKRLDHSP